MDTSHAPIMVGTTLTAVVLFLLALRRRSWTLWLAGYLASIAALIVAWRLR
jgi:uncharacterized membrane protein